MTPRDRANKLIEERVEVWHESVSLSGTLAEHLGWSDTEYQVWVESSEPPAREIALQECADLIAEAKVREADVSDGSRVKWGHNKQITDLKKRIEDLSKWRDKHSKGSEVRSNYSRLIQRLKGELRSAQAAAEKKKKKSKPTKR